MAVDLLLINPYSANPHPMIPLGLASLAAFAQTSYRVQVVDAWAEHLDDPGRLRARLEQLDRPRVVGVSLLTPNLPGAHAAVTVARQLFPQALLVIGGPHVSALPGEVLDEFEEADIGVFGEGEETLVEVIATYLLTGAIPRSVPGTIRREAGATIQEAPRATIKDLDTLPRPALSLFPLELYHPHPPYGRRRRYLNIMTSRGCPFKCAYCTKSVFGNSYRAQSAARVVDDITALVRDHQVRELHFYDDDLTLDRKRSVELMERLSAADLDLIWSCTTRCDLVDPALLGLMKRAGCWMVSYGVESGNDKLRALVNKGVTRAQIVSAFRATQRADLRVTAYFMVGLPGETEATVEETIGFMHELRPDYVNWSVMSVYPGSPFFSDLQAGYYGKGRLVGGTDGAGSPYQDSLISGFEGELSRARMEELVQIATRRFYLRPGTLFRLAADIRSLGQLRDTTRAGLGMLRWLISAQVRRGLARDVIVPPPRGAP